MHITLKQAKKEASKWAIIKQSKSTTHHDYTFPPLRAHSLLSPEVWHPLVSLTHQATPLYLIRSNPHGGFITTSFKPQYQFKSTMFEAEMGADWGPVIVAVALFILLSPGLLFQVPARYRFVEFGNMNTSGIAILIHALIFFCILTILVIAVGIHVHFTWILPFCSSHLFRSIREKPKKYYYQ